MGAPEVLERKYDRACDAWSCGIVLHILLLAVFPFKGESEKETEALIRSGNIDLSKEEWRDITEPAQDILRQLLTKKKNDRITAAQAMRHKWVLEKSVENKP